MSNINFDQITLTDQEMSDLIAKAKREKYFRLQDEQRQAEKQQKFLEALRPWSVDEMREHAIEAFQRQEGHAPEMDAAFKPVFNLLSMYFSRDPQFEASGKYSLRKGILLFGPTGTGKTSLLRAFKQNKRRCFVDISTNKVCSDIGARGLNFWEIFAGMVPGHGNTEKYFFQPEIGWMIDDLGTEEIINDYGNKLDAMDKIIQERYSRGISFDSLHMTTNMDPTQLAERYGSRFASRIREMFNIIIYNGNDRRN